MNKFFSLFFGLMIFMFPVNVSAQDAGNMQLPPVSEFSGTDLFQALRERQSLRAFSEKELAAQDLGDTLWAAGGVKTIGGKWLIPFARRTEPTFRIYVTGRSGTYLYNGAEHLLEFVSQRDLRAEAALQEFVAEAPVVLLFVANPDPLQDRDKSRPVDELLDVVYLSCGAAMQDVYLVAAAKQLATCYIGSIKHGEWEKELQLTEGDLYFGAMPLGYPAE